MKKILIYIIGIVMIGLNAQTTVSSAGRLAFRRLEEKPELKIAVNHPQALNKVKITSQIAGHEKSLQIPVIKANSSEILTVPLEANLRPGAYPVTIIVNADGQEIARQEFQVNIINHSYPNFPVIMQDSGDPAKLQQIGFTHSMIDASSVLNPQITLQLDELLKHKLYAIDRFTHTINQKDEYPRLDRDREPYSPANTEASNPEVIKHSELAAELAAGFTAEHPALAGAWLNPGARINTNPSFGAVEPAAYKKFSGLDIPSQVNSALCPNYQLLKDFPGSRIIPEKYPLWSFYHWFWTTGDGWNHLQDAVNDSYYARIRHPFITFTDSVLAAPPFLNPESHVDCLTDRVSGTVFSPLLAAYNTDRLTALTAGSRYRMVMPTVSTHWTRNEAAPGNLNSPVKPLWLEKQQDTETITIAPDYLREVFWATISRKIDGLVFNGYGSLVEEIADDGYNYTSHDARNTLRELIRTVILPLGPMLRRLPENKPEILILHSAASRVFADDHSEWLANLHLALQWGNFNVKIIYEDQVKKGALQETKILVLPGCEVLTDEVFQEIKKFQKHAGIVIGDEYLVPGIIPDLMIRSRKLSGKQQEDKIALQRLGADLHKALEPHFKPYLLVENQNLVAHVRSYKVADYVFVINDKRAAGEYVGPWGKVLEQGQNNEGNVYVKRNMNYGYDLVNDSPVMVANRHDSAGFFSSFETCDGRLVMLLPEEINEISIEAPTLAVDKSFKVKVQVLNPNKKPIAALFPMQVTLHGADDAILDGSGYYCAVDGVLELDFTLAQNEPAGALKLVVKDIASRKNAIATIEHK